MNAGRTCHGWFLDRMAALSEPFARLTAARDLAIASITAFAVFGAGTGVSFLAQVVAARLLGAHEYGEYAIVVAWTMLLASFCTLGFHVSLVRLIPAYLRCEKWSEANGTVRFAIGIAALVSVVVAALGSAIVVIFISKARPDFA
jgi:O-antigen/teichoic acid export membrane protein